MEKIKAIDPKIVVSKSADKPYYSIEYYNISDKRWHIGYGSYSLKFVKEWLNNDFEIVEADVAPVRHGYWIEQENWAPDDYYYTCSACREDYNTIDGTPDYNFCPNCGAKMDLKEV